MMRNEIRKVKIDGEIMGYKDNQCWIDYVFASIWMNPVITR